MYKRQLTNSASERIISVLNKDKSSKFRVYVTGGGCSGFQYGFKFDDDQAFDDDVIDFGSFQVLIDSLSYPYLYGSTLDFVEDLSGAKFVINNPNAKTTCGCGDPLRYSFSYRSKQTLIEFIFSQLNFHDLAIYSFVSHPGKSHRLNCLNIITKII